MIKNIIFILGTRPEAIKLAPVILKLKKHFNVEVCCTGQHQKICFDVFKFFKIKINYILFRKYPISDLTVNLSKILLRLSKVLNTKKIDLVIIQGDTTSTLAGALFGFNNKIKIAHIEAGLRSHDQENPFPEESYREIISRLAYFNFCPTAEDKNNLKNELIKSDHIYSVGNTVVDAINLVKNQNKFIGKLPDTSKDFILITTHRRELFGVKLNSFLNLIKEIALKNKQINFFFMIHPNPNISISAKSILKNISNIILIKPQFYSNFIYLMNKALLIVSDSGGIQEEVITLNKPLFVIRKKTERSHGLKTNFIRLLGVDMNVIKRSIQEFIDNPLKNPKLISNPYGDGNASERILLKLQDKISNEFKS